MHIPLTLQSKDQVGHDTKALIDSGASGMFINKRLVNQLGLPTKKLSTPIPVYNVDGSKNRLGVIIEATTVDLIINGNYARSRLLVTELGKHDVILGMTWLQEHNPVIDWQQGTLRLRPNLRMKAPTLPRYHINNVTTDFLPVDTPSITSSEDEVVIAYLADTGHILIQELEGRPIETVVEDMWIRVKATPATSMAQEKSAGETSVPPKFKEYADVFEKKKSERFPPSRPWDHAIDLKPDFIPRDFPMYAVAPAEEKALREFIDENLRKGYIRPSKSPMTSPFFFVGKKGGDLRPCQDYRYLNAGTIENRYPVPSSNEVIDQLTGSKIFTKFDLRAGYNNVRIKEGDEWKAAFKTKYGPFEPTVMFFGLCNSPATFQNMMDDIFREEVNEGWLGIYMDDMV